ncbi:MAG: hypothetical protein COU81_01205 [Candidatus Portnoybacteria bacterium CG10_big_fil_rev_8_21_14_0_10_36_7]|uniref:phenylalanine--tRNA ligase n=1 Tax=Candidatus Portnoybacteria bacterium CG10_big_fil_rev_8_21_14_0_10_36_7 TaxID=1974812 RepID=A0A2M8KEJ5_9BACT|nr:MAG: hypothetical protein COU81_01205 [Candidatus Portnoybacteria bacterium CG10_big_fil_rev_8_21_14_0_10_36_7]
MNVLIPYTWLRDYVETSLTIEEVADLLSLHSFSVEKIHDINGDKVMEIEVTSNRGDALSVLGIARELRAILPAGKFKSKLPTAKEQKIRNAPDKDKLEVIIKDKSLVSRFCAIVLENVKINSSPKDLADRLEGAGTRAINNIIDITNYLMLDKGQPMHAFDYDKIKGSKMIVRSSNSGEKITTLDGIERTLPEGAIVIEDGEGRLVDLCGIMGAENSGVDSDTKKVILFVQIYDPIKIRKASMKLGHRTEAALRFEKGVDPSGVLAGLVEAVSMAEQLAGAKVSSKLIDIVNNSYKPDKVKIDYERIQEIAGVELKKNKIDNTLKKLGFNITAGYAVVPSWREGDILISEDLAEEVIRIYGYHELPTSLNLGQIPKNQGVSPFKYEEITKNYLKHHGCFECYNLSAVDENKCGDNCLAIDNPLTQDASHLRVSLLPQLIDALDKNQAYDDEIIIFELSAIYLPRKNDLPLQPLRLGLASKGIDYLRFKGIISGLFEELGVESNAVEYKINKIDKYYLSVEIDFEKLISKISDDKHFSSLPKYNISREDMTFVIDGQQNFADIQNLILSCDKAIRKAVFKYIYKNFLTLSIEYYDSSKQLSANDLSVLRDHIIMKLNKDLNIKLKK